LPDFRSNTVFETARRVKWFLRNPKKALKRRLEGPENALMRRRMRSKKDEFRQLKSEVRSRRREEYDRLKTEIAKIQSKIKRNKQEIKLVGKELLAAKDPVERSEYEESKERLQRERARLKAELRAVKENERTERIGRKKRKKTIQQEIFQIERERGVAQERRQGSEEPGTLPDFLIIGAKKSGTTFLYHLLTRHPLVEPAASKELHFFDVHFELGLEWYRRFFSAPRWEDGERTITGEASPYLAHPLTPERIAGVVPQARLIALLRNPVERTYSDYQMVARKEREHKTFEEAIGAAVEKTTPREEGGAPKRKGRASFAHARPGYLSRSVYIDQLLRWSEFFDRDQLLILKSEDFFENPRDTLQPVLEFLGLPGWEPAVEELESGKRNEGGYEREMDPATRRRLEEYFEPHNRRLYDFLGTDFGW
jgi:hypothetical protein